MPLSLMLSSFFAASPKMPDNFSILNFKNEYKPEETLICGHARRSCYISPEGRVLMCMPLTGMNVQDDFPCIPEKSLAECLSAPDFMKLVDMRVKDFIDANEDCQKCEYLKHCTGGCRALALEVDKSNLMNKAPIICELFFGGWPEKIIEAVKKVRPSASPV